MTSTTPPASQPATEPAVPPATAPAAAPAAAPARPSIARPPVRPSRPPPARPPGSAPPVAGSQPKPAKAFAASNGLLDHARKIVIYGPGGIGKSSLAGTLPDHLFIDVDRGTADIAVNRIAPADDSLWTWTDMRDALHAEELWKGVRNVIIDSGTAAQELATAWVIKNVRHEKGARIESIEDYGWGKGFQHVYDAFLLLLADLDQHVKAGRNVVLLAHDVVAPAPNPQGEDFLRYEPQLQSPKSGVASIRNRVIAWADEVLFVGYDVLAKDRKGIGEGSRTIYPTERPSHRAKSRILQDPIPYTQDSDELWRQLQCL